MKSKNILLRFFLHPIWHYSIPQILRLVKSDWADELVPRSEFERLQKDVADLASGAATIHDIAIRNGMVGVAMSTELARVMADSWIKHLDQTDAKNYLEFGFKRAGELDECIIVIVQRAKGKSPHILRLEAESELAALKVAIIERRNRYLKPEYDADNRDEYIMELFRMAIKEKGAK